MGAMIFNIGILAKVFLLILTVSALSTSTRELNENLLSLIDLVSGDRIMSHVESLTGFDTRYVLAEECNESAVFLYRYFSSLEGFDSTLHYFNIISSGRLSMNVVACKNGTNIAGEYVLLFAHYDSISNDPYVSAPGANDNACGVAVMMDIARIASGFSWNRTLIFIAFSGEEIGFAGSSAWVRDNEKVLENTVGAICLDGVGRGRGISIMYADEESKVLADLTLNISTTLGFKSFQVSESALAVAGSDSNAFLGRGLRVIRLWDEDTTFIHTPLDTPETLSLNRMVETAKLVLATLFTLSTEPLDKILSENPSVRSENNGDSNLFNMVVYMSVVSISLLLALLGWKLRRRLSRS